MRTRIVVPTFNERDNLETLVERVLAADDGVALLVVDDGSPDGTAELARELGRRTGRVELLERPRKLGLGSAYREGFARALADPGTRYVGQMDADLSHPPEAIPELLGPLREDRADLVVGSRWVAGGAVAGWPWRRRMLSVWGNRYARAVARIPQRDVTAGFRFWSRALLARIPWDAVRADGFGFQIETSWHAARLGARVVEVPIRFRDRARGASKMSAGIVREALTLPWRLRRRGGDR